MRKIYITFGGRPFDPVTKRIVEDGVKFGAMKFGYMMTLGLLPSLFIVNYID